MSIDRILSAIACLLTTLTPLGGCAPPTERVDLSVLPQATADAMVHVLILPLGMPAPPGTGSIGMVTGYGCGESPAIAANAAVAQLQIKALRMQAVSVVNVMFDPGWAGLCTGAYSAIATGTAVAARGIPSSY